MKTYLVQIEDHDDVISARDKVSWSKARRVLLVWPKHSKAVSRRLDLLLLLRFAQQQGTQLAVVASSAAVRASAAELGIPVFDRVEEAQQLKWRRPRKRKLAPGRRASQEGQTLRAQRDALANRQAVPLLARLLVFAGGVLAVLLVSAFLLPSARVEIQPTRVPQTLAIAVRASTQTALATVAGGAPAGVVSVVVEGRDQVVSTGRGTIPERAAAGALRLTNLTDADVEVPAGSIALTDGSPAVRYTITRAVRVPAGPGESIEAPSVAVFPGSAGNQPAGSVVAMEGHLGLRLAVENEAPMRGGAERTGPAPTQADYLALRATLLARLQHNAAEELRGKAETGQRLLPATMRVMRIMEETREPEPGQPGDQLQLALRVEYQALAVLEEDLRAVAQAALDVNRLEGYRPVANTLVVDVSDDRVQGGAAAAREGTAPEAAELTLHAKQDLEVAWSGAELAQLVRGRTLEDALQVLQATLALDAPPVVRLFPNWWPRMPFFWQRIEMEGT